MRKVTTDKAVLARHGPIPVGDIVLRVTVGEDEIARMDIYWHHVTVAGNEIPVAWFDHLYVDPDHENMGFGPGLLEAGYIAAAREMEWGAGYSPRSFFENTRWLRPDDAKDHLLVIPLTGIPQVWPSGEIIAASPSVED